MERGYQTPQIEIESERCCQAQVPIIPRISPCLLPIQITPKSRFSSFLTDPKTNMSCGSLSPISPRPSPTASLKDLKILVTDSDNNNSVFVNFNEVDVDEGKKFADPVNVTASQSLYGSTSQMVNTSNCPTATDGKIKSKIAIWTLVGVSSVVLCHCIGLAVFLSSSVIGIPIAILGVGLIVFVSWISYRTMRSKSNGIQRHEYQRLGGKNYCGCSPSMTNIFYQCSHESGSNMRRGSTASRNKFAYESFY